MNLIVGFCFADVFINVTQFERVNNCCCFACRFISTSNIHEIWFGSAGKYHGHNSSSISRTVYVCVCVCVFEKGISGLFTMKRGSQSVDYG